MTKLLSYTPLLFCLALCLKAQDIRFSLDSGPYYRNCPFALRLVMENTTPDEPPSLAPSDDFIIQTLQPQNHTNSSISIINGKRTEHNSVTTIYTFQLIPKRTGTLKLPACIVKLNGKIHRGKDDNTIDVSELDTNSKITLKAVASKNVCAVGEPITLEYTWTSQADIRNYDLALPLLTLENADIEPVQLSEQQKNSRGTVMLSTTNGSRIPAMQYATSNRLVIKFSINIIPRKPGRIAVAPATIVCDIVDTSKPRQRRQRRNSFFEDPFDDPFFGPRYATTRCAAESKNIIITVKEPPAAARPASYTGLAEPCTITVNADTTDVYVGDPIVLTITVKGPRFPNSVRLPKLSDSPAFQKSFRVFDNDAPGAVNPDSSITFKRTIRAASTDATEIPPVEIAWFNADDESYHTAATAPIPISVKATRKAQAITAEPVTAEPLKVDVTAAAAGPSGNFSPAECLDNQFRASGNQRQTSLLAVLLACPAATVALAMFLAFARKRRENATLYRARGAAKNALRILANAPEDSPCQAVILALNTFAADKLQRNAEAITLQDIENFLRLNHAPEQLIKKTQDIVRACEEHLYAKNNAPLERPLVKDAQMLVAELAKALN